MKEYLPGYPYLVAIGPPKEDIRRYVTTRLKQDPEPDVMGTELEAEILTLIQGKISGAYVKLIIDPESSANIELE